MRWQVTGQRPVSRPGPGLSTVAGYDVTVTTDTNHTDTVFVPLSEYNPDGITRAVNTVLRRVEAVDGLEGDTTTGAS